MAGKKGRGRDGNFRAIDASATLALLALASGIVVKNDLTEASDAAYYAVSCDLRWSTRDMTAAEGPIVVGVAHDDLTVTEIKEALESKAAISRGDIVANEKRRRPVRRAGMFAVALTDEVLNDGRPIRLPLKMRIPIGVKLAFFAYNKSGAALTTGGEIVVDGPIFIRYS